VPGVLRHIPNVLTSIRILLVAPIAVSLCAHRGELTVVLFGVAALTDVADGMLAKRYGWQTDLGALLDPVADKLLLVTVFITLAYLQRVPLWLMQAAVLRDVVIVGGALAYRHFIGPLSARPSTVSKLNTLCQAAFVLSVVAQSAFAVPAVWVTVALGALVFVTVVVSGIDYVLVYARQAWRAANERAAASARSSSL
jgi:cardiolipin synthase (CMP-forming)